MLFKMVWSWSTSFLALMASSRFFATSAPGNSPNRKLEAIQKKSWQLHLQSWFDLSVGHHHIHFRIAKSLITYDSYCVEVISHICDSVLVVWGRAALTTAILDKMNGASGPPLPSISMMPKWRVFAPSRLHSCFGGGGWGLIVSFYSVQDCGSLTHRKYFRLNPRFCMQNGMMELQSYLSPWFSAIPWLIWISVDVCELGAY